MKIRKTRIRQNKEGLGLEQDDKMLWRMSFGLQLLDGIFKVVFLA